jgi:hypothetical protein
MTLGLSIGYELLMYSSLLLLHAINCHFYLLVFIATILPNISYGISTDCKYDNSVSAIMPVTTRSKSRLLISKCNEQTHVCSASSPLSSQERIDSTSSLTSSLVKITTVEVPIPFDTVQHTTCYDSTSSIAHLDSSRGETMDISKFRNSKFENLKYYGYYYADFKFITV